MIEGELHFSLPLGLASNGGQIEIGHGRPYLVKPQFSNPQFCRNSRWLRSKVLSLYLVKYRYFTPPPIFFLKLPVFHLFCFPKRLKKFGFRFIFDYWPSSSSPVHSVLNVRVYSHRKQSLLGRCPRHVCPSILKARLHRRFMSRQLDAIFVALKLQQVSNMFETPAISRRQIALKIAPGLHVRFWSCNC